MITENPVVLSEDDAGCLLDNCKDCSDYSCSFSETNIWNSNLYAPEMTCDFAVLHKDLQEIKKLVNDINNCIKDFFAEQ